MIRPLRQRHRRMVMVLGVVLPVVCVAGIAARKSAPVTAALPVGLVAPSLAFASIEWERSELFPKTGIQIRLRRESAGSGRYAVELSGPKDFVKPDMIVYWVAGTNSIADSVPDNAQLLGGFSPAMALPLPMDAAHEAGRLLVYSLADQEIVDLSKPITLQKP